MRIYEKQWETLKRISFSYWGVLTTNCRLIIVLVKIGQGDKYYMHFILNTIFTSLAIL
jgi:hypothetical protein